MFVIIYLDNILVYLKNEKNYKKHVKQILSILKKVDLKIVIMLDSLKYRREKVIKS